MAEIFDVLRASLFTNEDVSLSDWRPVFREMQAQSVAALAYVWLSSHPIPEASAWTSFCLQQQAQWVRVMHGQTQLLQLLDANDIPCVILKGASAAMAYPHPTLRSMGDVDFLVKRADFEKAAKLLEENGYALAHDKNPNHHHYAYSKNGISFELHKRLGIVRETDERLISLFEQGIDAREFHEMEGVCFPTLPPKLNGLVLLFHIDQHLRSGLGLRQIVDWMLYLDKRSAEEWNSEIRPFLREIELERFALTVTAMCQKYLGLRTFVEDPEQYPCDELMDYIMEKGNFGRKAGIKGKTASFSLETSGGVFKLFKRLHAGGMSNWKAAKKYKILRPFAWIYQVFHILRLIISNKMKPKEILNQRKHGEAQRQLIEALGLKIDRMIE